jgi:hypothetical protein
MNWLRVPLLLVLVLPGAVKGNPGAPQSALQTLEKDFVGARSLPVGARPAPPDLDLQLLVGLKWSIVRAALGSADKPIRGYDWQCDAKKCEVYTYGASEAHLAPEIIDEGNGLKTLVVTTGGPWVLILGVSSSRVTTARWQGQK